MRARSDTQVMWPALPGKEMPRRQEFPFSWSCLKLFLDRENLQGLSLGFGGGVKGGCVSGWCPVPSFTELFIMPPFQGSLEV